MEDPASRIDTLHKQLVELDRCRTKLLAEIKKLQIEISTAQRTDSSNVNARSPDADKIRLFQELFSGREDVFPLRFESRKSGRSGYQPACANEWRPGVCHKPKIKCSRCESREFIPVTDEVVRQHLSGKDNHGKPFVMGVYPLREDETCSFLAVDFDKDEWRKDALAFLDTCVEQDVPAYLERSRSGNGGHVWIFFSELVSARVARKLGSFILTTTMSRRPELGFDSYDRFFPNQDRMPSGGFGNLIALPLQKAARAAGNSEFVDRSFVPVPDQWSFLSNVRKMQKPQVIKLVKEAERDDLVLGVRAAPENDDSSPWLLPPSLRNALLRLAAFRNPEFYKAQAMRLPVFDKPRIIACAEEFSEHIALPRGCYGDAISLLKSLSIKITNSDQRTTGSSHSDPGL